MSGRFDYEQAERDISAELRAVTWIYRAPDGTITLGNLIDGCPCLGFRFRQRCKHYTAAADAYDATTKNAAIIGTLDNLDDE